MPTTNALVDSQPGHQNDVPVFIWRGLSCYYSVIAAGTCVANAILRSTLLGRDFQADVRRPRLRNRVFLESLPEGLGHLITCLQQV